MKVFISLQSSGGTFLVFQSENLPIVSNLDMVLFTGCLVGYGELCQKEKGSLGLSRGDMAHTLALFHVACGQLAGKKLCPSTGAF